MLYASWRTNVKLVWNVPRSCHTYFVDSVLAPYILPPQVYLMSRFLKFFHSLLESPSPEVQVLSRLSARDLRTNVGSNLAFIKSETGLDPWMFGGRRVRDELLLTNRVCAPERDLWRLSYLRNLVEERLVLYYEGSDELHTIDELIESLVSH